MSRALALDPALANFGWAVADVSQPVPRILAAGVIKTEKSSKKLNVGSADDNQRRMSEIAEVLLRLTDPKFGVKLIVAEQMTLPTHKLGALGVMAGVAIYTTIAKARDLPVVTVAPKQLKLAMGPAQLTQLPKMTAQQKARLTKDEQKALKKLKEQRRGESKQHVQDSVLRILAPQRPAIEGFLSKLPSALHEHAFDAIACLLAAGDHQLLRMLRQQAA